MREPDVDRERDAAPAAPAQLTVMSSGSAARPGPEGPSGIVRVEPETRSERAGVRSWASELPGARAQNPDFLGPESRKSGSGFRERNPGPPARADRKPRLRGGAPSRKPGAKARPRRSGFRHRTPAPVTLAPPVTSTACPSYTAFRFAAASAYERVLSRSSGLIGVLGRYPRSLADLSG